MFLFFSFAKFFLALSCSFFWSSKYATYEYVHKRQISGVSCYWNMQCALVVVNVSQMPSNSISFCVVPKNFITCSKSQSHFRILHSHGEMASRHKINKWLYFNFFHLLTILHTCKFTMTNCSLKKDAKYLINA